MRRSWGQSINVGNVPVPLNAQKAFNKDVWDDLQRIMMEMFHVLKGLDRSGAEEKSLLIGYLKTSSEDLRASKILYGKGMFTLATYHLQQSVEKATKAYCLGTGLLNAHEVRSIGHDSLKGHQLIAEKLSGFIPELGKIDPKMNVDLAKMDKLEEGRLEIAKLDSAAIDSVLNSFDTVDKSMDILVPQLIAGMHSILATLINEESESKELRSNVDDIGRRIEKAIPLIRSVPFLFVASALTFPHEAFTRYPDGEIKPWDYGMSMGIVARMPELIRRMEMTLEALEAVS